MPPGVTMSNDLLMMNVWCKNFDFEPQISSRADKLDNHFGPKIYRR